MLNKPLEVEDDAICFRPEKGHVCDEGKSTSAITFFIYGIKRMKTLISI